jgi:hypothetical protein
MVTLCYQARARSRGLLSRYRKLSASTKDLPSLRLLPLCHCMQPSTPEHTIVRREAGRPPGTSLRCAQLRPRWPGMAQYPPGSAVCHTTPSRRRTPSRRPAEQPNPTPYRDPRPGSRTCAARAPASRGHTQPPSAGRRPDRPRRPRSPTNQLTQPSQPSVTVAVATRDAASVCPRTSSCCDETPSPTSARQARSAARPDGPNRLKRSPAAHLAAH